MPTEQAARQLISGLGQKMGSPELTVDTDGACALKVNDRFVVGIQCRDADDEIWFYVDLGVPAMGPESYEQLLRANLFWLATSGATLSLSYDEPPHAVIAMNVRVHDHDATSLADKLKAFLATVHGWSEQVSAAQPEPESGREPTSVAGPVLQSLA